MAATLAENDHDVVQVNANVDIYNREEKEILLFDDRIQVKSQTAERQAKPKQENKSQKLLEQKTPAITTDLVIVQANTGFEYIAAPINAKGEDLLNLASIVKAKVIQEYGSKTSPLNLVAITDGARTIRGRLITIFGVAVTLILDWYHLCKKL